MNKLFQIIKNDIIIYRKYGIFQTVIILSLLLALSMVFISGMNPLIVIYITVFVLPVIVFSISTYIEKQDDTFISKDLVETKVLVVILAKVLSALLTLLIPMIIYLLLMKLYLHMNFSVILFILVYLLSAFMHILVGMVLAAISKTIKNLTISYLAYIIIFSVIPIFYIEGFIPVVMQYFLVISPAYNSGVLFDYIILGYSRTSNFLTILAVTIQLVYIFLLSHKVLKPYFKNYLKHLITEGEIKA